MEVVFRSAMPVRPAELFRWHERPEALQDLLPPGRFVRIESRDGGVRDGDTVTLSIGVGPFRIRWKARHFGYVRDVQFCDEQVSGPFKAWRHTHRVEPKGDASVLEDRIELSLYGGPLVERLAGPLVRRSLARAFARRHEVTRSSLERGLAA
jgi:ligand-binding SRPBCC domain-containing protein